MNAKDQMHILHVLDHSLPEQSGYAYRSHSILTELMAHGVSLKALTGPKQGVHPHRDATLDGVVYERTPVSSGQSFSGVTGQLNTIRLTRQQIAARCREGNVQAIHVHSPCLNGLAALGHGVPVIYEMRSSWEDAAVSVGTTSEGSPRYRVSRALETYVCRHADAVVVICDGLRRELLDRGIPDSKITIAPNALPEKMFRAPTQQQIDDVRRRYELDDNRVIGFFGSFFEWEGIDSLVACLPDVLAGCPNTRLLLAGGGREEAVLRQLVASLGLENSVKFTGRVAQEDVLALYRLSDAVVFPRVSSRLTEMVTPIKPLEAMAQGTIVIASDVGGHRELIKHGETGFLYPAGEEETALGPLIIDVLKGGRDLASVRRIARDYVESGRRWSVISRNYLPLYTSG